MKNSRIPELVLSAAFLIVFAMTLHSNWQLRRELADTNAALQSKGSGPKAFVPGDTLPQFPSKSTTGSGGPVLPLDRESLLVVIDPSCGTCERVVREVNSMQRDDLTVVALQRPNAKTPLPHVRPGVPLFEVMRGTAPQFTHRIGGVPRVYRIAPGGTIRAVCGTVAECTRT